VGIGYQRFVGLDFVTLEMIDYLQIIDQDFMMISLSTFYFPFIFLYENPQACSYDVILPHSLLEQTWQSQACAGTFENQRSANSAVGIVQVKPWSL
jgi:hypothetical protein